MLQATEALKYLLGIGISLQGRLLHFNALTMKFREFQVRQNRECPLCGKNPRITQLLQEFEPCKLKSPMTSEPLIPLISVEELYKALQRETPIQLIDVREPWEYELCHIPGSKLIPLGELSGRMNELAKNETVYLQCRSGGRSAEALLLLQNAGFPKLYNVEGGILAWAERIDSSIKKY